MRAVVTVCVLVASMRLAAADARKERALAEQKCLAQAPDCDWLATLSSLERQSVNRAIAARGYKIEPSPWGKQIADVHVYNEDVFAEPFGVLQFFNLFHVTTKESAIEAELVIGRGELWDQSRIDETARRLRDPLWSSVVVVLPVVSATAGQVDMLVVTRDIWSLRLNTQYTFQQGSLTNLSIALSENNFLGTRSVVALGFTMDQGAIATGPIFIDKNLAGQKLDFRARVDAIFNRNALIDDHELSREGSQSSISLNRPLWSLASKWGAGITFSHRYAIDRQFRGLDLFPVDCSTGECVPARPLQIAPTAVDGTIIGVQYEMRRWEIAASAVRQWGDRWKHQVTVGQSVENQKPRPLDSFPGNAVEREAFIRDVLPRSELTSAPIIAYGLFEPKFRTLRNVDTYELAEDVRLGLGFDASYAVGLELLGSDDNFQRMSTSASYALALGDDGLVRPTFAIAGRRQDGEWIDNTASGTLRIIAPTFKWARFVALATIATRWNDTQNIDFRIGSDNGLRGFLINEFRGQRLLRGQLELRSIPRAVWVLRVGAVLFYELGGAADTFDTLAVHHDAGVGFRMLIPQTARDLFRFDFAVPLDTSDNTRAGTVRFIAGFESAF
ncbi:MAG TPA: hypothetical protein VFQ53_42270 [Kofleriaceae bacterium]|nr:hypothetical protein [Kofleriaceae bacterium]